MVLNCLIASASVRPARFRKAGVALSLDKNNFTAEEMSLKIG